MSGGGAIGLGCCSGGGRAAASGEKGVGLILVYVGASLEKEKP
jgi:hypothetical protein